MNTTLEPDLAESAERALPLAETIQSVCGRIPPLWSLRNFVAVNPFVGLTGRHFTEAARLLQRVGHGDILMPADFYLEQIAAGRILEPDFQAALTVVLQTVPVAAGRHLGFADFARFKQTLADVRPPAAPVRVWTFAEFLDTRTESGWAAFVVEEISKWCSAYYDQGQSSWRMPWRHLGLFAAWQAAAKLDANPELMGLAGFREFVAGLTDNPREFIGRALRELAVPAAAQADFLHRQLLSLPGWSSYVQVCVRQNTMAGRSDDSLMQFLAIRLAYDLVLREQRAADTSLLAGWQAHQARVMTTANDASPELLARYVAQQAWECARQREWLAQLKANSRPPGPPAPRSLQAIFCIDVRSEPYRRALEAQSDEIETIGFAGFFGMAFELFKFGETTGNEQLPVLLTPKLKLRETLAPASLAEESRLLGKLQFRRATRRAWNSFRTSAISCFSFVETAGFGYGVKLAAQSLALNPAEAGFSVPEGRRQFTPQIDREAAGAERQWPEMETGITLTEQISLAAGALKNMGLTTGFAQVVLFCGHGSATTNNPYGSGLDCGACGGHAGDANARVAAAILNRPIVRAALQQQGIVIPAETVFVAGLHNTTTDEVIVYADGPLSPRQAAELARVKTWLAAASRQARQERAGALGLAGVPAAALDETIFKRTRDWSQVRPEWGLAGNAAFIAAPRERTQGLNLGGRVFLHNYDASRDPANSTLELILAAPMVVASWINLQYYGSTVNNRLFGSGNKVLHNVVGTFGVWQGNGGDLQPGLPLQSLHDGSKWMHEPLRLSVFIAAEPAAIESVLARQPGVRELLQNGWVHLFAMDNTGQRFWRYVGNQFVEES